MSLIKIQILRTNKITLSVILLNILLIFPLVIQAIPIGGTILYMTLFFCACLFFTLNFRKFMASLKNPSLLMLIFLFYLFSFFIGICVTGLETPFYVIKEFIWGCFLILTLCCTNIYFDKPNILRSLEHVVSYSATTIAVTIALVSYLKYLIWKDGYIINLLLINQSLDYYPKGTALVGDINFFSLTLLICSFLSFSFWKRSSVLPINTLWMLIFFLLIGAGVLSGSRRFFILIIFIAPMLFFLWLKSDSNSIFKKFTSIAISLSIFLGMSYGLSKVPNISSFVGLFFDISTTNDTWLSYSNTFGTSLDRNQHFGLDTRIVRLLFSLELLDIKTILLGDGFHYIEEYSCKFTNCNTPDYPHFPILSAVLYGGIFGLISYMITILFMTFIGLKLFFFSKSYFQWGLALLSTIAFTFISGNSLFSMPVLFTTTIISYFVYKIEFGEKASADFKEPSDNSAQNFH